MPPAELADAGGLTEAAIRDRRIAEFGVLVIMVFWAGNFIVVKGAIEILPPVGFTLLRYLVASATLVTHPSVA